LQGRSAPPPEAPKSIPHSASQVQHSVPAQTREPERRGAAQNRERARHWVPAQCQGQSFLEAELDAAWRLEASDAHPAFHPWANAAREAEARPSRPRVPRRRSGRTSRESPDGRDRGLEWLGFHTPFARE
jgi:hypothetical protein